MAMIYHTNMPRDFQERLKPKKLRVRHQANESLISNPITHIESKTKLHDETNFTVNKSKRNDSFSPVNMCSRQESQAFLTKQNVENKEDSID